MESAVRLIPAVTLALLLKEEGDDDEEEEESSLAWVALQSRNPFRPRLNVRRSSRPFSVGEEESSEETTRLSSFDKVEAEPPSIREFSKPSRRVRIGQRDWFRWRFDCEGGRGDERWVEFEAKFATLSKANNSEKETKDEQEDTTGGICLFSFFFLLP